MRRTAAAVVALTWVALVALPVSALSPFAPPTFGEPSATTNLGDPLVFSSTITGTKGGTVDVLVRLVGEGTNIVIPAQPGTQEGSWQATRAIDVPTSVECSCVAAGNSAPNSRIGYQFRVRALDGTTTLGPIGQSVVQDARFAWQILADDQVVVHWYEGDEAFARSAASVANGAIHNASELVGVTLPAPVDLFIYATQEALIEAVAPNRENIAGEAHLAISTMFVWIAPGDAPSESAVTVAHELTHLVFWEATNNPFHGPPRWLNEGIAVYLSEGFSARWQGDIAAASRSDDIIPLEGLAGFFPSPPDQFELAYAEGVSAVDFFIKTYGEQTLWDLVRSYSQGVSDADAFQNATGNDVEAFNAAWTASLGTQVREPIGPQPAPAGPVPPGWTGGDQPGAPSSGAPSSGAPSSGASGSTGANANGPAASTRPATSGSAVSIDQTPVMVLALIVSLGIVVAIVVIVRLTRRAQRRGPPCNG